MWSCISDFIHFPKSEETSDLGFRTYLEFAKFTHEQLSEIYKPKDIKSTADWANLHLLKPEKFEMKELDTFLTASGVRQAFQKCRLSGIQANCCLKAMQTFFKYFCAKLLSHTASQSPIMRGVLCFDPEVLRTEPDTTGKPAYEIMANTMVRYNWIEQSEATLGRDEYDSLVVDLQANLRDYTIDFFSETEYMDARPSLFRVYKLASLCIGYGPRNIAPFERPFRVYPSDEVPTNSLLRCLQTSTYLREYSPELYCESHNLQEIWRIRDHQAGLFTNLMHRLKPWSTLDGTNKTFIYDTLESAYSRILKEKAKAEAESPPATGAKIVLKNKSANPSGGTSPGTGAPGPSRASTSTLISESAFLGKIPKKSPFSMSARKLEKGANVAKEVSSPAVEKAKGKTGPDPDATEAKRGSERVKNKERREEK